MTNTAGGAADLCEAAARFFPGPRRVVPLGDSPGFSGSRFARVEAEGRVWCLRHWPPGVAPERLRAIHRALVLSRANGFSGVPALARSADGSTTVAIAGALFDAQEWIPGESAEGPSSWRGPQPNRVRRLPSSQLVAAAEQLARFHASLRGLSPGTGEAYWRPLQQLPRIESDLRVRCATLAAALAHAGEAESVARRWLHQLPRIPAIARRVARAHDAEVGVETGVCHGDIWPRHLFFAGDWFAGFVDFEGLVRASPALDLAQLIVHCGDWREREPVLAAYAAVAPLGTTERALLPAAAALDLAGEGLWSLGRLHLVGCDATEREAHRMNLTGMLASLEAICAECS